MCSFYWSHRLGRCSQWSDYKCCTPSSCLFLSPVRSFPGPSRGWLPTCPPADVSTGMPLPTSLRASAVCFCLCGLAALVIVPIHRPCAHSIPVISKHSRVTMNLIPRWERRGQPRSGEMDDSRQAARPGLRPPPHVSTPEASPPSSPACSNSPEGAFCKTTVVISSNGASQKTFQTSPDSYHDASFLHLRNSDLLEFRLSLSCQSHGVRLPWPAFCEQHEPSSTAEPDGPNSFSEINCNFKDPQMQFLTWLWLTFHNSIMGLFWILQIYMLRCVVYVLFGCCFATISLFSKMCWLNSYTRAIKITIALHVQHCYSSVTTQRLHSECACCIWTVLDNVAITTSRSGTVCHGKNSHTKPRAREVK